MKQVAVGIILKNGFVLACQRRRDASYPLKWEFPGGKLEEGETPEAAVVRELHEELGIDAVVESEFFRQDWTYEEAATGPKDVGTFNVFYLLIREFAGTPVNHAFEQIRWVTPEELEAMDILEGNRIAVNLLVRQARESDISQRQSARATS
jgi:8-oxo-dGTP diphosphatase